MLDFGGMVLDHLSQSNSFQYNRLLYSDKPYTFSWIWLMKLEFRLNTSSLQPFILVPLAEATIATAVAMELTMQIVLIHEIKISQKTANSSVAI